MHGGNSCWFVLFTTSQIQSWTYCWQVSVFDDGRKTLVVIVWKEVRKLKKYIYIRPINRLQKAKRCIYSQHTDVLCVMILSAPSVSQPLFRTWFRFQLHSARLCSESKLTLQCCQHGGDWCSSAVNTKGRKEEGIRGMWRESSALSLLCTWQVCVESRLCVCWFCKTIETWQFRPTIFQLSEQYFLGALAIGLGSWSIFPTP